MQTGQSLPFPRLGKYKLLSHIATGGMGSVYKCLDEENKRYIALKILSRETAENPILLERFRREAAYAAQLKHKNIVTLYENGESDGVHYLAMEFIAGIDLAEYIRRQGQVDPEEARRIIMQACRALDHAFAQGITHRDIKPSNFLLANEEGRCRVKLTDLGLSRGNDEEYYRVTRDGTTVGTVDYMAPEQARDSSAADVRSDIYSLGCTFYHMLAGHPPFHEGGLGERVYKHLSLDPPDIRLVNPAVSASVWTVLRRMLAKHPDDRFQTPIELYETLRSINDNAEETNSPIQVTVPREAAPERIPKPPSSRETDLPQQVTKPPSSRESEVPPSRETLSERKPSRRTRHRQATVAEGPAPASSGDSFPISPEQRQAAAAQFDRARQLQSSDETAYALQLLQGCCKLNPSHVGYRQALRELARSLNQGRGTGWLESLTLLPLRGRFLTARTSGDHRKVLELGEELLARVPDDTAVQIEMANSAEALGLQSLAVWLLEHGALSEASGSGTALHRALAGIYERQSKFPQAVAIWEKVRDREPSNQVEQKITDLLACDALTRVNRR
jgi:serine/threonine protein kinase